MYTYHIFRVLWSSWEEDFSSPHFSGWSFCLLFQNKSHNKKIYYCYYLGLEFFSFFLSTVRPKPGSLQGAQRVRKWIWEVRIRKIPAMTSGAVSGMGDIQAGWSLHTMYLWVISFLYHYPWCVPCHKAWGDALWCIRGFLKPLLAQCSCDPGAWGRCYRYPRAPLGELFLSVCK